MRTPIGSIRERIRVENHRRLFLDAYFLTLFYSGPKGTFRCRVCSWRDLWRSAKKLIVYGSQARGEARPDSDVDLMIVLGGKVYPDEEAQRTSQLVIRLASEYGVALSPLHLSEENFERDRPLPRAARREGVVL